MLVDFPQILATVKLFMYGEQLDVFECFALFRDYPVNMGCNVKELLVFW